MKATPRASKSLNPVTSRASITAPLFSVNMSRVFPASIATETGILKGAAKLITTRSPAAKRVGSGAIVSPVCAASSAATRVPDPVAFVFVIYRVAIGPPYLSSGGTIVNATSSRATPPDATAAGANLTTEPDSFTSAPVV